MAAHRECGTAGAAFMPALVFHVMHRALVFVKKPGWTVTPGALRAPLIT